MIYNTLMKATTLKQVAFDFKPYLVNYNQIYSLTSGHAALNYSVLYQPDDTSDIESIFELDTDPTVCQDNYKHTITF